MKDKIRNKVLNYYNESHDFNGGPYWELEKLHISNLDSYLLQLIEENIISVSLYPTEALLNETLKNNEFDNRPFTKMLAYGKPQLILYFSVDKYRPH